MFDVLYSLEYVVLLSFGFSSEVDEINDTEHKTIFISVVLALSFLALGLKLFYYLFMHVWSQVKRDGHKCLKFLSLQEVIPLGFCR